MGAAAMRCRAGVVHGVLLLLVVVYHTASGSALSCSEPCSGFGYRDGRAAGCDRCPQCWTCAELFAYSCSSRNGLDVRTIKIAREEKVSVGETIAWRNLVPTNLSKGWQQCASHPTLPHGLIFTDAGTMSGTVGMLPYHGDADSTQVHLQFHAFNTVDWESGVIHQLELTFKVHGNFPSIHDPDQEQAAEQAAHAAADNAFRAYTTWERGQLDHPQTVSRMKHHLAELRAVCEQNPELRGGWHWMVLGALHMNIHKLMENVLPECEVFLSQGLLFPDKEVQRMAGQNLEGCYAKRLLEAAKFLWMKGLSHILDEDWQHAASVLQRAAGMKDGWGWGINNGDIYIALSGVYLIQGIDEWQVGGHDQVCGDLFAEVDTMLQKAKKRSPGHPWTAANTRALQTIRHSLCHQGNASANSIAAQRRSVLDENKSWCRQVLKHVQPAPRSTPIPVMPIRREALHEAPGLAVRKVSKEATGVNCSQNVLHPRDRFYVAMGLDVGVPPLPRNTCR